VVVVLCLAVAYAGRTSTFGRTAGGWSVQQAIFQPSAFAVPDGSDPDTLVRPPMANTLGASSERLQIMHYDTQPGDTISGLADRFDISDNTIAWANQLSPDQSLAAGQQLIILPVSGVLYSATTGDTVDEIARRFQTDAGAIAQFNQISVATDLAVGTQLVIPGGRPEETVRPDLSARSAIRPGRDDSEIAQQNPAPAIAPDPAILAPGSDGGATGTLSPIPFKARTSGPKPLTPLTYSVVAGDTLSSIALHFGVSPASIAVSSGLQGSQDSLSINQKLTIPPVPGVVHVVQSGDTLEAIAGRYAADPNAIARANDLKDPFKLQIGQTLVVPGGKAPAVSTVPAAPTTYTVTEGDSVSSIAASFSVDLGALVSVNGLSDPYVLQPGQQITIPGAGQSGAVTGSAPAPVQPHTTYTVQAGDSVSGIADSFGVNLNGIVDANNLSNPTDLQPGQQLVIPGVGHAVVHRNPAPVAVAAVPAPRPVVVARPAAAPARSSGGGGWGIVSVASRYLGTRYVWGGTSPGGFDCSGFVWYTYQRAGVPIPRDMWGQLQSGTRVSRSSLKPGDIVFFAGTYESGLSHDGIYLGGGRFINAVDYGIGVAVSNLNDAYWSGHYFGATRPW